MFTLRLFLRSSFFLTSLQGWGSHDSNPYDPPQTHTEIEGNKSTVLKWSIPRCIQAFNDTRLHRILMPGSAPIAPSKDSTTTAFYFESEQGEELDNDFENLVLSKIAAGKVQVRVFGATDRAPRGQLWVIESLDWGWNFDEWEKQHGKKFLTIKSSEEIGWSRSSEQNTPLVSASHAVTGFTLFVVFDWFIQWRTSQAIVELDVSELLSGFPILPAGMGLLGFYHAIRSVFQAKELAANLKNELSSTIRSNISYQSYRRSYVILSESLDDSFYSEPWAFLNPE